MSNKMTSAQIIVDYLIHEKIPYVLGIFGHGNVQLGEALKERENEIRFIPVKNEQNAVHIATAYAKTNGQPLAVTTSIGPGATNLVTGAACAHINRLPVLLLPGDAFASGEGPVLQQIEGNADANEGANDCLKPVSVYWRRITRPEQLQKALPEAFDRMMQPGNMGPAVLCLPMDVQAEEYELDRDVLLLGRDKNFFQRTIPETVALKRAAGYIARAKRPIIISGGGVIMSGAEYDVKKLAEYTQIPVVQTQAGNGTMLFSHKLNAFSVGPAGSDCGNELARQADLVIGIGTRYTDFTTSSDTLFGAKTRFININISPVDVGKQRAIKLQGDARATLELLIGELKDLPQEDRAQYIEEFAKLRKEWIERTTAWRELDKSPLPQSTIIAAVNDACKENGVVVAAAGSLPGDLLRLWRTNSHDGYHIEYGYSTMGYEIAGGIGVKLARPSRDVYVMVGDGSFLMASQEIVTAVHEHIPITIVLVDNNGHRSIRGCQESNGFTAFGTGPYPPTDFPSIAKGYGAHVVIARTRNQLKKALGDTHGSDRVTVIYVPSDSGPFEETNYEPSEGSWWNVPNSKRVQKKKQTIR